MKALRFGLLIVSSWALTGCDRVGLPSNGRYATEKDSSGNVYVVDTQTGNVEVLAGDSRREITRESEIAKAKALPPSELPGMPVEISGLTLKYRHGLLLYRGDIKIANRKPVSRRPEARGHGNNAVVDGQLHDPNMFQSLMRLWEGKSVSGSRYIVFYLVDVDRFVIESFIVTRESLHTTVDGAGTPCYLSFIGSRPIDASGYKAIYSYYPSCDLAAWNEPGVP